MALSKRGRCSTQGSGSGGALYAGPASWSAGIVSRVCGGEDGRGLSFAVGSANGAVMCSPLLGRGTRIKVFKGLRLHAVGASCDGAWHGVALLQCIARPALLEILHG